jgi:hypothetical protein
MSRLYVALVLATAGAILFGQGIYIHAKAMLAQVLLERAFAVALGRYLAGGAHHGETAWRKRDRARRQQRPGAGLRGPAMWSAPPMPANAASPSIRRIGTLISGF